MIPFGGKKKKKGYKIISESWADDWEKNMSGDWPGKKGITFKSSAFLPLPPPTQLPPPQPRVKNWKKIERYSNGDFRADWNSFS